MFHRETLKAFLLFCFVFVSALSCESINSLGQEKNYSLKKQFDLPDELAENSGIIFYDSLIWTFNDYQHEAAIYGLDLDNGQVVRTVYFAQTENIDWEDITQDEYFIYVGDFGNNSGDRDDLAIYKIAKSLINKEIEQVVHPIKILFHYEDQTDFDPNYHETSFDCEAIIVKGDSLLLFTKDWVRNTSTIYSIPKFQGNYEAKKSGRINSNGLVTGADDSSGRTVLCGYQGYIPFVISILHGDTLSISNAPRTHFKLYDHTGYQLEGIGFFNDRIYLTAEKSATLQGCWEFIEK